MTNKEIQKELSNAVSESERRWKTYNGEQIDFLIADILHDIELQTCTNCNKFNDSCQILQCLSTCKTKNDKISLDVFGCNQFVKR
jgi:hypothetical protein